MANIKIAVIVDTEKINRKNVNECCSMVDNTRLLSSPFPPDFETFARAGSMIEWSGIAKDPASFDCVSIDSIALEDKPGNEDLFGEPVLIGSGGVIQANLLAHIPVDDTSKPREETYKIRFTVIDNRTGENDSYDIDPKLKAND